jgi:hypothetical protein
MRQRHVSEAEVRRIIAHARRYRRGRNRGTFLVDGRVRGTTCEICVAPEHDRPRLSVVTVVVRKGTP